MAHKLLKKRIMLQLEMQRKQQLQIEFENEQREQGAMQSMNSTGSSPKSNPDSNITSPSSGSESYLDKGLIFPPGSHNDELQKSLYCRDSSTSYLEEKLVKSNCHEETLLPRSQTSPGNTHIQLKSDSYVHRSAIDYVRKSPLAASEKTYVKQFSPDPLSQFDSRRLSGDNNEKHLVSSKIVDESSFPPGVLPSPELNDLKHITDTFLKHAVTLHQGAERSKDNPYLASNAATDQLRYLSHTLDKASLISSDDAVANKAQEESIKNTPPPYRIQTSSSEGGRRLLSPAQSAQPAVERESVVPQDGANHHSNAHHGIQSDVDREIWRDRFKHAGPQYVGDLGIGNQKRQNQELIGPSHKEPIDMMFSDVTTTHKNVSPHKRLRKNSSDMNGDSPFDRSPWISEAGHGGRYYDDREIEREKDLQNHETHLDSRSYNVSQSDLPWDESNQDDVSNSGIGLDNKGKYCPVTSSGRNKGCGKAAEPKFCCQICGDVAAGYHCGAYVCEACKKFYLRCLKNGGSLLACPKTQQCEVNKENRSHCQFCRYQKCITLGMYRPGREDDKLLKVDFQSIPCKVCDAPSSGFHFGAITCEGCKGFFRRMLKMAKQQKFQCSAAGNCMVSSSNRTSCKACRFNKCHDVGMKLEGTRLGRQSNSVKRSTLIQYQMREFNSAKVQVLAGNPNSGVPLSSELIVKKEPLSPACVTNPDLTDTLEDNVAGTLDLTDDFFNGSAPADSTGMRRETYQSTTSPPSQHRAPGQTPLGRSCSTDTAQPRRHSDLLAAGDGFNSQEAALHHMPFPWQSSPQHMAGSRSRLQRAESLPAHARPTFDNISPPHREEQFAASHTSPLDGRLISHGALSQQQHAFHLLGKKIEQQLAESNLADYGFEHNQQNRKDLNLVPPRHMAHPDENHAQCALDLSGHDHAVHPHPSSQSSELSAKELSPQNHFNQSPYSVHKPHKPPVENSNFPQRPNLHQQFPKDFQMHKSIEDRVGHLDVQHQSLPSNPNSKHASMMPKSTVNNSIHMNDLGRSRSLENSDSQFDSRNCAENVLTRPDHSKNTHNVPRIRKVGIDMDRDTGYENAPPKSCSSYDLEKTCSSESVNTGSQHGMGQPSMRHRRPNSPSVVSSGIGSPRQGLPGFDPAGGGLRALGPPSGGPPEFGPPGGSQPGFGPPGGGPPGFGPPGGGPPGFGPPGGGPPGFGPPGGGPPGFGPPGGGPPRFGPPGGGPSRFGPPGGGPPRFGPPGGGPPRFGPPGGGPPGFGPPGGGPPRFNLPDLPKQPTATIVEAAKLFIDRQLVHESVVNAYRSVMCSIDDRPESLKNLVLNQDIDTVTKIVTDSFMHQSKICLRFMKKIPGFKLFQIPDQIILSLESIYPLVLVFQSQYYNSKTGEYRFFINTPKEVEVVFNIVPNFASLQVHFKSFGFIMKELEADETERALLSCIYVFSHSTGVQKNILQYLEEEYTLILMDYCEEKCSTRAAQILARLSELKTANFEHRELAMIISHEYPQLNFGALWGEIFLSNM